MADLPDIFSIPTPPDRQEPSTFADRADAWVAAFPDLATYLRQLATFSRDQAQASLAAAIAGNLSALDLSNLAGEIIGVNAAGTALEGVQPGTVLLSDVDLSSNTLSTETLSESMDGFRWLAVIGGVDADEYGTFLQVPRADVTAEVIGTGVMYLGVLNNTADTYQLYSVDVSNGTLTSIGSAQSVGSGAVAGLGMTWTGVALYLGVLNDTADTHQLYSVDTSTGGLIGIGSAQSVGSDNFEGLGLEWAGTALYLGVLNSTDDNHQLYSVNTSTGVLTAIGAGQSVGNQAYLSAGLAWDGSTLYLGVLNSTADTHQLYSVDTSTGTLTAIGTGQSVGSVTPSGASLAWDGSTLYLGVVNDASENHQLYSVDVSNGTLTSIGSAQSVGGSATYSGAGMAWSVPITGGALAGPVRLSRDSATSLGLRATRTMRIHQIIGLT